MNKIIFKPESLDDFPFDDSQTRLSLEDVIRGVTDIPSVKTGLLFFGPYGTGKTELALAMTKFMEDSPYVSSTGFAPFVGSNPVEIVGCHGATAYSALFERIRNGTNYSIRKGRRYFIFNEVDTMPNGGLNGLKSLMDRGGPAHVTYLLTTNKREAIPAALRSRCLICLCNPLLSQR